MRPVHVLVSLETIVLALLTVLWWLDADTAPLAASAREADSARPAAPPAEQGEVAAAAPPSARVPAAIRPTSAEPSEAPADILLHGRLTTSDGSPLPERLSFGARHDGDWRPATTLGDRYAIAGLTAGDWNLELRADGYRQSTWPVNLDGRPTQVEDIVLEPAPTLRVFVTTPDGEPPAALSGAQSRALYVVATAKALTGDLPPTEHSHTGDLGIGRFRSGFQVGQPPRDDGAFGELWLDQDPPANAALVLRHVVLAQAPIAAGQTELHFVVAPSTFEAALATVTLRLIDGATGTPITADAFVRLATAQGGGPTGRPDETGRVTLTAVPPGIHELSVNAGVEREQFRNEIRIARGAAVDLGEIRLHPALTLRGRVLDAAGEPVPGASLLWTDLGNMTWPRELANRRHAGTDGEGRFAIGMVGPRRYVLVANHDGGRGTAVVDLRGGTSPEVEIRLRPSAAVRVAAPEDGLDGYMATLLDADGVPVDARRIAPRYPRVTLAAPSGRHTLVVRDVRDAVVHREELELAPGSTTSVEVGR